MPWPCRGVAVLVGLMCIPAETIRPHPNLTCNLQVAACSIRGGAQVLTVRAAFLSPLLQLQLLWVCFCLFFSAPLLVVNWDPIWLRTIVTVLLVTVRDPRNNNTLQKGRREETSTKESLRDPHVDHSPLTISTSFYLANLRFSFCFFTTPSLESPFSLPAVIARLLASS